MLNTMCQALRENTKKNEIKYSLSRANIARKFRKYLG